MRFAPRSSSTFDVKPRPMPEFDGDERHAVARRSRPWWHGRSWPVRRRATRRPVPRARRAHPLQRSPARTHPRHRRRGRGRERVAPIHGMGSCVGPRFVRTWTVLITADGSAVKCRLDVSQPGVERCAEMLQRDLDGGGLGRLQRCGAGTDATADALAAPADGYEQGLPGDGAAPHRGTTSLPKGAWRVQPVDIVDAQGLSARCRRSGC